jgi:hypothetical protein
MYVNGKMTPVETIPGMRGVDKGELWRGWIQLIYLIYYKHFCKCHNVPLPSTIVKRS